MIEAAEVATETRPDAAGAGATEDGSLAPEKGNRSGQAREEILTGEMETNAVVGG